MGKNRKRTFDDTVKKDDKKAKSTKYNVHKPALYIDTKYVEDYNNQILAHNQGSILHMSPVPRGTSVKERLGRAVRLKNIQLRGIINPRSDISAGVAMYLVWDSQVNRAQCDIRDILYNNYASAFVYPWNLTNRENAGRFKIIRKWHYGIGTETAGGSVAPIMFDEFVKLPSDLVCQWTNDDLAGTVGNCTSGALFLVTVGENPNTTPTTIMYSWRTSFEDI